MKRKIISCLFFMFLIKAYGQTYSFSTKVKKASVQTSTGYEQRVIARYSGPYRFVFETPNDPSTKKLFTLLYPGQEDAPGLPWYGYLKEMGYLEKDGKLLKKYLYYYTGSDENVMVLIAEDYSLIVIFRKDETIEEYIR